MKALPGRLAALLLAGAMLPADGASAAAAPLWKHPPRRLVLNNGMTLLHQQDGSSAVTSLAILIGGGRRAEPAGMSGSAYLAARLMLEMPDGRSARRLMLLASPLSLGCQGDFCLIEVEALSDHFEDTLRLLSRPMLNPLFTDIRIDALKRFMGHLRLRETEEAPALARSLAFRSFFGPEGYGASDYGTETSLRTVKGRDLARLYESLFRAENVILSAVSDRTAEEISLLLEGLFKDIRRGKPHVPPPLSPPASGGGRLSAEKDTVQSLVGASFLLPGASPEAFALASLAESLLGKGVGSRLWTLRQAEGLAYNVSCAFLPMKDAGVLEAYLETENDNTEAARTAFYRVLDELSSGGVSGEELEAARRIALTEFLRDTEAKNARARNMAFYQALGLGHDFLEKIPALMAAVSVADMNAFLSQRLNPDRAAAVMINGTRRPSSSSR
jgi:zinc protease